MPLSIVISYRLDCDWPTCTAHLNLYGCESIEEAKRRARRDGWAIANIKVPIRFARTVRCPDHGYERRKVDPKRAGG